MSRLVDQLIEQNGWYRNEGSTGVSNLCKLVRALGYKDYFQNGHLSGGGVSGDLLEFLGDNPGAIEAITVWIRKHEATWKTEIEGQLEESSDEDDEENDDEE